MSEIKRTYIKKKYEEVHKMIDGIEYKQCTICEEWFPCTKEYFYKNKLNKSDGLYPYCRPCTSKKNSAQRNVERQRELCRYYYRTREATREAKRRVTRKRYKNGKYKEWMKNNPDKQKKYAEKQMHKHHKISNQEWLACKNYFNNECAYCGISEQEAKEIQGHYFHMEHAINEGANDLSNCIPSCRDCNSKKWAKDYDVWYKEGNVIFDQSRLDKIIAWLNGDYKLYIIE